MSRTMTPMRRLAYRLIIPLGFALIHLVWGWVRKPRIIGLEHMEAALAQSPSIIAVCWHQHSLFGAKVLLDQRARGVKPGFLVSPSVDGEIGALLSIRFGARPIRGSASHTGARALRDFYAVLVKDSISPLLNPDGPRGPRFVFKPGAIVLSQLSGRPIVPIAYYASRATLFHWDRFVIPWPFARVVIAIGEPIYVPRALKAEELPRWQEDMRRVMKSLFERARDACNKYVESGTSRSQ